MLPGEDVLNERSEYEPDEPDPGAEAENVEFDVTSGEDLVASLPDESDVSPELVKLFWSIVLIVNGAVLAVSLGPMLIYFRGMWTWGGGLVILGVIGFLSAYLRYRRYRAADEEWD